MSLDKSIRLSGIIYESLVNGPGLRRVLFSQGCKHNCKGCFNPSTHCYDGGELRDMDELLDDIRKNPMLKGVTFSGGDPFEQASEFSYLAEKIKETNLNIWCYTGYTFEYIFEHRNEHEGWEQLLNNIDVLVDGKFEEDKKSNNLKYRGSSNQRIIDVKKTLNMKQIITLEF
ncbi:ribonucleoside-triphosphate reductase activating protein [Clostridium carboxidivorans P7]|uniref:Anaerobic ribonucleoside-triphosphate reductase-activating protein n=1 Tax=Clostridium carboxidivorans P7 TaxID=536227 RepID=C6Q248_9CLOT|nr:anaerobic ribonucleoside-triphosphate reductase activating protein [Clostridium carboxidivorans]AKN33231.1 ribonucleoside-triphosphate reductase activating protein [Clostridium carboxidivorans P7]EET84433.1 anaerobic ribonucleoside-triphosphate reductase activating protein [Clostridium carboxidivorans P7]